MVGGTGQSTFPFLLCRLFTETECSPCWPGTQRDPPASASRVLGSKAHVTILGKGVTLPRETCCGGSEHGVKCCYGFGIYYINTKKSLRPHSATLSSYHSLEICSQPWVCLFFFFNFKRGRVRVVNLVSSRIWEETFSSSCLIDSLTATTF